MQERIREHRLHIILWDWSTFTMGLRRSRSKQSRAEQRIVELIISSYRASRGGTESNECFMRSCESWWIMDHSHPHRHLNKESRRLSVSHRERGSVSVWTRAWRPARDPLFTTADTILAVGKENIEPQLSKMRHLLYFFTPQALCLYRSFRQSTRPSVVESWLRWWQESASSEHHT